MGSIQNVLRVQPRSEVAMEGTIGAATGMTLQATTHQLAWRIFPEAGKSIDRVLVAVNVTGTVTGHTYSLEVQSDSAGTDSGVPSGTILGAVSASFAGPAASGFIGANLGSATGALSANVPYWIVLKRVTGTPDGSNYLQSSQAHGTTSIAGFSRMRKHDGTNWTNVAAVTNEARCAYRYTDGKFGGIPMVTTQTNNGSATDIYGSNKQGTRYRFGSVTTIAGAYFIHTKSGTPNSLKLEVFEGASLLGSGVLEQSFVGNNAVRHILLSSPVTVAADADCYLIFSQDAAGGNNANDYDTRGSVASTLDSNLVDAFTGTTRARFVYGTSSDPTALTVDDTFFPYIQPLVMEPDVDFDSVDIPTAWRHGEAA